MTVAQAPQAPFQFTPTPRLCPTCRVRLVMIGTLQAREASGLMGRLGVSCHCIQCNTKFRAQGGPSLGPVWWVAPGLARWIWWAGAEVTVVTTWTSDSSFLDTR